MTDRCEHGFVTCTSCKVNGILPGCYWPGCGDRHATGEKFCPKHGGSYAAKAVDGRRIEG